MVNQPTFAWSVDGSGLIDSSGDYQPPYATIAGSPIVRATAGGKTGQTTATYPGVAQWNSGSGSWTGGSWIGTTSTAAVSPPGLRAAASDYAQFATSGGTISLGGVDPSLAGLSFASANSYTLSGGAMKLNNGASPATIGVSSGNHTILTPVTLQSSLNVTVLAGDSLTISGGVSGSGEALILNGPGKMVLGGNNSFNGGTTILSGTLVVSGPSALPNGSNLAVGANLRQVQRGCRRVDYVCLRGRRQRRRAECRRRRWRFSAVVGPSLCRRRIRVRHGRPGCGFGRRDAQRQQKRIGVSLIAPIRPSRPLP